ncbi:ATP-binding protein [Dokdonia ponticola]|uniref:ATP-binding protein n=1 Tax=Dokdonia ponticola TaxID=2041041 RepID=A0ABV9HSC1_9FLAO
MSKTTSDDSSAKIKDVYIELDNYKFFHTPYNVEKATEMNKRFVGREKIKDRIRTLLTNDLSGYGTYLITGFRGMGKTSVLRQAIAEVNQDKKEKLQNDKNEQYRKRTFLGLFKRLGWFYLISNCVIYLFFDFPFKLFKNEYQLINTLLHIVTHLTIFTIVFLLVVWKTSNYLKNNKNDQFNYLWEKPNWVSFWSFIKLASFLFIIVIITLYFVYPTEFCGLDKFGFNCFKFNLAKIPIKISNSSKYFSLIAGLLTTYFIISAVLFSYDTLYRYRFNRTLKEEEGRKEKSSYKSFEINLSQDTISDREVLKRINDKILEYWEAEEEKLNNHQFQRTIYKPFLFLIKLTSTGKKRNISKYHQIKYRLLSLRKRLEGSVSQSQELGSESNYIPSLIRGVTGFSIQDSKSTDNNTVMYSPSTAKEAEDELISIFDEIQVFIESQSIIEDQFIFIVDELDKIEPQSNSLLDEREFSNPAMDTNINIPGSREYRKRQEAVAKLLANLKGFLSTAKAKFFFIGGRELFDADLADIADRDSFYSSIFNDVIYVDSFYKDNPTGVVVKGISGLTEIFLINLIKHNPIEGGKDGRYNLKKLFNQVQINLDLGHFYINSKSSKNIQEELNFKEFKIFSLLQNYIIYLTYRGTGSPKKLTSLVESLIVSKNYGEIEESAIVLLQEKGPDKEDKEAIEKFKNRRRVYIKFGFNTQYEINLTNDILRPYLITNSRFLTNIGDKLLFSTPFIFDHIIKFYPYGFAWRNLELIPEVVLVNKEPYLRDHIKSILKYLSNSHIKESVSGLHDFKFHSIVKKELAILTKRSDLAAAAFNFTLDESLLVKRHYKKKLIELREKYKNYQPLEGDNQFIHSLSFVQTILGDLYFYDKEYDEAILYYTESIQSLRLPNAIGNRYLTRHQYLIWLRNKLKIGLTLEKIEAYDSAISLYRTLMIDSEIYLKKIVNSNLETYKEEITLPYFRRREKKETRIKPEIGGIDHRSEDHRNMHLVTLPFVAQLTAIEKLRTDGITYSNLYQNKEELKKILHPEYDHKLLQDSKQKSYLVQDDYRKGWLWADYFSNVGSILFYKNCQFTRFFSPNVWNSYKNEENGDDFKESEFYQDEKYYSDTNSKRMFDSSFYLKTHFPKLFRQLHLQYNKEKKTQEVDRESDYHPSLTSICYYWEALNELTIYQSYRIDLALKKYEIITTDKSNFNPLQYAACYLLPEFIDMINTRRFYYLGNVISKIGDAILASLNSNIKNTLSFCDIKSYDILKKNISNGINKTSDEKENLENFYKTVILELKTENLFSLKKVLFIYSLANELYKKSNHNYNYTFGQKKILIIIKEITDSLSRLDKIIYYSEIEKISEKLCESIIRSNSWYNTISNRAQIKKYRDIFNLSGDNNSVENTLTYNNVSNNSDALEAIILTETIKLKLNRFDLEKRIKLKETDTVHSKYIRLLELKYHTEIQYKKVINLVGKGVFSNQIIFKGNQKKQIEKFTIEALFALRESIKIIQMYSPGYIIGYSYLATAHMWSGDWCKLYEKNLRYKNYDATPKQLDDLLNNDIREIIGQSSMYFLESNYQYETAIQNYHKVLQMHSEGLAYKDKLCDLFVLEDDYNDSLTHFNLALERFQVNTGQIRERIDYLKTIVDNSKIYEYENYSSQE